MATITNFENLEIWKKSRELCQKIFILLIQTQIAVKILKIRSTVHPPK